MSSYIDSTGLVFSDGTKNYAPTPFSSGAQSWNLNGSSTNKNLDFTDIPSWATRVTVAFYDVGVTTNTSIVMLLGDSGGIETSGYRGTFTSATTGGFSSSAFTSTAGFTIQTAGQTSGVATLQKAYGNDVWVLSYVGGNPASAGLRYANGFKDLSATLTQIRLQAFDTGSYFSSGDIIVFFE